MISSYDVEVACSLLVAITIILTSERTAKGMRISVAAESGPVKTQKLYNSF